MWLSLFVCDALSLGLWIVLIFYRTRRNRYGYRSGYDWFWRLHYQEPNFIVVAVQFRICDCSYLCPLKQLYFLWITNLFPRPKRTQRRFKFVSKRDPSRGRCLIFIGIPIIFLQNWFWFNKEIVSLKWENEPLAAGWLEGSPESRSLWEKNQILQRVTAPLHVLGPVNRKLLLIDSFRTWHAMLLHCIINSLIVSVFLIIQEIWAVLYYPVMLSHFSSAPVKRDRAVRIQ